MSDPIISFITYTKGAVQFVTSPEWETQFLNWLNSIDSSAGYARDTYCAITAGFPCQDVSFAGDGAGLAGERSGLYRHVIRAIRLVRPRFAHAADVEGLATTIGGMQSDLEFAATVMGNSDGASGASQKPPVVSQNIQAGVGDLNLPKPAPESIVAQQNGATAPLTDGSATTASATEPAA